MFETTLEAQQLHEGGRKAAALSAALLVHVLVVIAAIVASLIWIRPPHGPERQDLIPAFLVVEPPRADNWRPPRAEAPPPPKAGGETQPALQPPAPVQPHETPAQLPTPADVSWLDDTARVGPGDRFGADRGVSSSLGSGPGSGVGGSDGTGIGGPLTVGAGIVPPVLLKRVEPDYPVAARLARLGGHVLIEAVVGTDGSVESARIVRSTSALFDDAALDAVRGWKYSPARMEGRPVRVYFKVSIDFVLK